MRNPNTIVEIGVLKRKEEPKKSVIETLKEKKQEAQAAEAVRTKSPVKDKDQAVDLS